MKTDQQETVGTVKNSFTRLVTELREAAQKGNNWPAVQPAIDRLDGAATNFFTAPEQNISEARGTITQHITSLREVCEKSNLAPALLPVVAGIAGVMGTFWDTHTQPQQ